MAYLSVNRVAQRLHVRPSLVRSWCQTGLLKYGTFGKGKDEVIYVTEEELENFEKKWGGKDGEPS